METTPDGLSETHDHSDGYPFSHSLRRRTGSSKGSTGSTDAAGNRVMECAIERQVWFPLTPSRPTSGLDICEEFNPIPPVGVLTVTRADTLHLVPPQLATETLDISVTVLHDLFRKMVDAASAVPVDGGALQSRET